MSREILLQKSSSGNCRKFWWLYNNHPDTVTEVIDFCKKHKLDFLPWPEQVYHYANNITDPPIAENGLYKSYWKFGVGYSKTGRRTLDDIKKQQTRKLDTFRATLSKKDLEAQDAGGQISQRILENPYLFFALKDSYNSFVCNEKISEKQKIRCMIYMWLNELTSFPKCENCNNTTRFNASRGMFTSTCSEICRRELILKKGFKTKSYVFPSGKKVELQGYEDAILDFLLKHYAEDQLLVDNKSIQKITGKIKYPFEGSIRTYYPDILIKSENKIIEVKSSYTYQDMKKRNIAKMKAVLAKNIDFEFWIYDKEKIIDVNGTRKGAWKYEAPIYSR